MGKSRITWISLTFKPVLMASAATVALLVGFSAVAQDGSQGFFDPPADKPVAAPVKDKVQDKGKVQVKDRVQDKATDGTDYNSVLEATRNQVTASLRLKHSAERVAQTFGCRWPVSNALKPEKDISREIDRIAEERASAKFTLPQVSDLQAEFQTKYPLVKIGERVTMTLTIPGSRNVVEGQLTQVNPVGCKVSGRSVSFQDMSAQDLVRISPEANRAHVAKLAQRQLNAKMEERQRFVERERLNCLPEVYAKSGYYQYKGAWIPGESMRKIIETQIEQLIKADTAALLAAEMSSRGFVQYRNEWLPEGVVKERRQEWEEGLQRRQDEEIALMTPSPPPAAAEPGANTSAKDDKRMPGGLPFPRPADPVSTQKPPGEPEDFVPLDISKSFVMLESKDALGAQKSTASGFLVRMKSGEYIITNAHCLIGQTFSFRTPGGVTLTPQTLEVSPEVDLVRISFSVPYEDRSRYECLDISVLEPKLDALVRVFGNSDGGMVMTTLDGKVKGVGPDRIEVGAEIVRGNSGGPMINKAGRVVGIASYLTRSEIDWTKAGTRFDGAVRRFGYRLRTDTKFTPCPIAVYLGQQSRIEDIRTLCFDYVAIFTANHPFIRNYNSEAKRREYTDRRIPEAVGRILETFGIDESLQILQSGSASTYFAGIGGKEFPNWSNVWSPEKAKQQPLVIADWMKSFDALTQLMRTLDKELTTTRWVGTILQEDARETHGYCTKLLAFYEVATNDMKYLLKKQQ